MGIQIPRCYPHEFFLAALPDFQGRHLRYIEELYESRGLAQ